MRTATTEADVKPGDSPPGLGFPKVSVIISTYQHEHWILETLASVQSQTFTDYEVIVVNDGSPDRTAEVLRPLRDSGQIRYFEQEHAGLAAARNRGLAEARGEYIAFLDDGDLLPPGTLASQVRGFEERPEAIMVYGFCVSFDSVQDLTDAEHKRQTSPELPSGRCHREFLVRNFVTAAGQTLIRKEDVCVLGGFDAGLDGATDYDLWIRLADVGRFY